MASEGGFEFLMLCFTQGSLVHEDFWLHPHSLPRRRGITLRSVTANRLSFKLKIRRGFPIVNAGAHEAIRVEALVTGRNRVETRVHSLKNLQADLNLSTEGHKEFVFDGETAFSM